MALLALSTPSYAQPHDFAWVRTEGGLLIDRTRAIAAWPEQTTAGSFVGGGFIAAIERGNDDNETPTPPTSVLVRFTDHAGNTVHDRRFLPVVSFEGAATPTGLAAGFDDGRNHTPSVDPTTMWTAVRQAYVVGNFTGRIDFKPPGSSWVRDAPTNAANSFIRFVRQAESSALGEWILTLDSATQQGQHRNEALAVAVGPRCAKSSFDGTCAPLPLIAVCDGTGTVVVGGYYSGSFRPLGKASYLGDAYPHPPAGAGDEDGYIALIDTSGSNPGLETALRGFYFIEGPGRTRVTAVAVDPRDMSIIVAGEYSSATTDVWPGTGGDHFLPAPQGQTDVFIVKYKMDGPANGTVLVPLWVATYATSLQDTATGLAITAAGDVYVGGHSLNTTTGKAGAYAMRIDTAAAPSPAPPRSATIHWVRTWTGIEDQRVLAVSTDGLGRAVLAGRFGAYATQGAYTLNFNQGSTPAVLRTATGADAFMLRLWRSTGQLESVQTWGGLDDDTAETVSVDAFNSDRIGVGGTFGADLMWFLGGGSPMDADPGPGVTTITPVGSGDAYFSSFRAPAIPNLKRQFVAMLDASPSAIEAFKLQREALGAAIRLISPAALQGGVAMSVTSFAADRGLNSLVGGLPWVVLTPANLEEVARWVETLPQPLCRGDTPLGLAIEGAAWHSLRTGPGPQYSSLLFLLNGNATWLWPEPLIADALTAALEPNGPLDQVNGVTIGQFGSGRSVLLGVNTAWGPHVRATTTQQPAGTPAELTFAFAGEVPTWNDTNSPPFLGRMLDRMAFCPADYNRNGTITGQDLIDYSIEAALGLPYADWDFNRIVDPGVPGDPDFIKFDACFDPPSITCP